MKKFTDLLELSKDLLEEKKIPNVPSKKVMGLLDSIGENLVENIYPRLDDLRERGKLGVPKEMEKARKDDREWTAWWNQFAANCANEIFKKAAEKAKQW